MALLPTNTGPVAPDHGYHELTVGRVTRETADASSFALQIPATLRDRFAYEAGQFCTFRVVIGGQTYYRCYSMSSAPGVDAELQVTVKRVPDGKVSNWLNDVVEPGHVLEASPPAGRFVLTSRDAAVVAFGAGSGVTPVFSLMKSALAATERRVRLLYANRDRDATIFGTELDELHERHRERIDVTHHLDVEDGFVTPDEVRPYVEQSPDADFYVCGPPAFMDVVETTLLESGVAPVQLHIERFDAPEVDAPVEAAAAGAEVATTEVIIELDGETRTADYRPGTTLLQMARQVGLAPPFSCEAGNCATCMAKMVQGEATLRTNNALTDDEIDDGWVLTCQAVPTSPSVHVVYGFGES